MNDSAPSTAILPAMVAANLKPSWPSKAEREGSAPNVLQIVFDDTGWSDFGCYGSSIDTPNIDGLAQQGLRYTNFHVTPLCSPTRASLMTGRNHHSVGMRFLTALNTGFENSRGEVRPDIPMVPALLKNEGYGTYLVGKWHLTPKTQITPAGPFAHWPLARGFDRFFGFLDGCTDQYKPELYHDNAPCQRTFENGEHLNDVLADQAIEMLADHTVYRKDDPFYMTFAVGATHAPLQAPRHLIDKYVPLFETGWDVERDERLKRQIDLGLAPKGTQLTERNPGVSPWDDLSAEAKQLYVRQQAAYAAFLEHTDAAIGRILHMLDKLGLREDTLIMVLADNGASREGGPHGAADIHSNYSGRPEPLESQIKRIDDIGTALGPAHYPEGWAMASNTPFRRYKQLVDLGGVRAPLIVSWPKGISEHGAVRTGFAHVVDLAATVAQSCGLPTKSMHGESLAESFASPTHPTRAHQYWEMFGHRAIWKSGWKAVTEHENGADYNTDIWRLYNTNSDFSESCDLAQTHPEKLAELQTLWMQEALEYDVFPLDDRPMKKLLNETRSPDALTARKSITFYPENGHIPVATGLCHVFRPMRLRADFNASQVGHSGTIIASGAGHCGYRLSLADGMLTFEHSALGTDHRIETPLDGDARTLGFEVSAEGDARHISLLADGRVLIKAHLPYAMRNLSFWGMDIGQQRATSFDEAQEPLSDDLLHSVTLEFEDDSGTLALAEDHAKSD